MSLYEKNWIINYHGEKFVDLVEKGKQQKVSILIARKNR